MSEHDEATRWLAWLDGDRRDDGTVELCGTPYQAAQRIAARLYEGERLFGGFAEPARTPVPATAGSKLHRLPPSEERAALRSMTPVGFARAAATTFARALREIARDRADEGAESDAFLAANALELHPGYLEDS